LDEEGSSPTSTCKGICIPMIPSSYCVVFERWCSSVGVRVLKIEYSRGIIVSRGYVKVTKVRIMGCASDTSGNQSK